MFDSNCLFCKIVAGDIPAMKVLEDDVCLAFMDIGPLADGHVLLIPKFHAETLDKLSIDHAGDMLKHLPALVHAVQAATSCQGVNVLQNNGVAAHQEVMHVHFHVIPRNEGDAFGFNWPSGSYESGRMEELAEAIRKGL
ncbi:MAG: HIT family protein [Phycisphaerae bacterium]|jgi:histidine triad (HIT) family protein|nr:HIT family protein [Phycisphaerae bacterium]